MRILVFALFGIAACGSPSRRRPTTDVHDASALPDTGPEPDAGHDAGTCRDVDGDGHLPIDCGGDDCDDTDDTIHPGADPIEVAREWEIDLLDLMEGASATVIDEDGVPHVFFLGAGGDDGSDLVHATRDGDDWEKETIDDVGETGHCPSAVLDEDGTYHVAYCEVWSGSLLYATGPDPWRIELVTTTGTNMIWSTAIAIGPDGWPRIAYHDGEARQVRVAIQDGAGWTIEIVRITAAGAVDPSLAIDAAGIAHVGWVDYSLFDARRELDGWVIDVVDDLAGEGPTGHVLDSTGTLQLFYTERDLDDGRWLERAVWRDGTWERETVVDELAGNPRPVAAPGGHVVVAYGTGGRFSVADDLLGAWHTEDVAPGEAANDLSLARDSRGGLHVSTSVGRAGARSGGAFVPEAHARYAYRPGADGIDQNCDGTDGIDEDGDGHASLVSFGDDCDDSEVLVHPGLEDPPGGGDLDCDGVP